MSNGFLSQEEIDSLLNGDAVEEKSVDENNEILSDVEKDLLGEIGNISMGSASTALYQLINNKVNITTPKVEITTLNKIKNNFDIPNIILDVEYITGIVGRNILIMKVTDAAVIASLMMGGDGHVDSEELTEIEISAVQEAMNQMIGSAATSMATMFSREVNISPPHSKIWSALNDTISEQINEDEEIVKVSFDLEIAGLLHSEIMQILPIQTAKKVISIMMGEDTVVEEPVQSSIPSVPSEPEIVINDLVIEEPSLPSQKVEEPVVNVHKAQFEPLAPKVVGESHSNIDLIMDVSLDVSVVLGRTKKSIRDILSLGTGSLIELDKLADEPVEVLINGKKIAYGEVVVVDENFGVRITNIVSGAERINSLK